jgi:hypothetical protein
LVEKIANTVEKAATYRKSFFVLPEETEAWT